MFFQHKPRFIFLLLVLLMSLFAVAGVSAQDATSAQLQPDCTPVQPEGWVVYVVQRGDNLGDIAARAGTTIEALQRANCIENPRRIVVGQRLFVPTPPVEGPIHHFLRRCFNAGFTEQECRRIWNALHSDDDSNFAERCLNAGYTAEQCRRIWNALYGDDDNGDSNLPERCRAAGYTLEECRRLINDQQDDHTLAERCRAAGYTPEECRRLYNANNDDGSNLPERCRNAGLNAEECRRLLNASQDDGDNSGNDRPETDRNTDQTETRDRSSDSR